MNYQTRLTGLFPEISTLLDLQGIQRYPGQKLPKRRSSGRSSETSSSSAYVDSIALTRAISELPDGYRKVFVLHDIQGYEHKEIGQMLGCADGTSKSQLFKARRKLHKLMTAENTIPIQSMTEEF